jgi:hypothetical protein
MRSIRAFTMLAGLITVATASTAGAQLGLERPVAGYVALTGTPIGALSPFMTRDIFTLDYSPLVFHLRYGILKTDSLTRHSAALTGEFPVGRSRVAFTGGFQRDTVATSVMFGAEHQLHFSRGTFNPGGVRGPMLQLTWRNELGFGTVIDGDEKQTVYAFSTGLPMSVPIGDQVVFAPFVSPGLAVGVLDGQGATKGEAQVTLSGGLVIHNPSRLDLTLGFHRALREDATTVVGVGITWNR